MNTVRAYSVGLSIMQYKLFMQAMNSLDYCVSLPRVF